MGRKSKYTFEEKLNAILDYKNNKRGKTQICNDLGFAGSDLYKWIRIYDKHEKLVYLQNKEIEIILKILKKKLFLPILMEKDLMVIYPILMIYPHQAL